jgi:hypothetical protein
MGEYATIEPLQRLLMVNVVSGGTVLSMIVSLGLNFCM